MTWQEDPVLRSYHGRRFWLNRCRECGFMQPEGLPNEPNFFARLYSKDRGGDWMEADFTQPYKDRIFTTILRRLALLLPAGRRTLLDVGTHVGRMPYLAAAAGWRAEGVELNPAVAAFAAKRTGLPIRCMAAEELAAAGRRYDAVVFTDVLEHIPDPVRLLEKLRTLVAPGGWLAVKVPCGMNQLRKERVRRRLGQVGRAAVATNMVHVNHFTPAALRVALGRAGFESVRMTVGCPELPPPRRSLKVFACRAVRLGVYLAARLPGGLHTPLALNLQAYARRPDA